MVKRKNETGEFSGMLALIRRGIGLGNMFVDRVTSLCEETLNDRICGSWISHEGNRNLLIRKQGSAIRLCCAILRAVINRLSGSYMSSFGVAVLRFSPMTVLQVTSCSPMIPIRVCLRPVR